MAQHGFRTGFARLGEHGDALVAISLDEVARELR